MQESDVHSVQVHQQQYFFPSTNTQESALGTQGATARVAGQSGTDTTWSKDSTLL